MYILGISGHQHGAAAASLRDGRGIAAVGEEGPSNIALKPQALGFKTLTTLLLKKVNIV